MTKTSFNRSAPRNTPPPDDDSIDHVDSIVNDVDPTIAAEIKHSEDSGKSIQELPNIHQLLDRPELGSLFRFVQNVNKFEEKVLIAYLRDKVLPGALRVMTKGDVPIDAYLMLRFVLPDAQAYMVSKELVTVSGSMGAASRQILILAGESKESVYKEGSTPMLIFLKLLLKSHPATALKLLPLMKRYGIKM